MSHTETYEVTPPSVNVRETPFCNGPILKVLIQGKRVEVWEKSETTKDGYVEIFDETLPRSRGYINRAFLHKVTTESPHAQGNTERALAVAGGPAPQRTLGQVVRDVHEEIAKRLTEDPSSPLGMPPEVLVVGQRWRIDEQEWQLCENKCTSRQRTASSGSADSSPSPYVLGEYMAFFSQYILQGENISNQPSKDDQRASTRSELELRDECGNLATQLRESRVTMQIAVDAMADVMAWLGPTKVREFEKWRTKTRK